MKAMPDRPTVALIVGTQLVDGQGQLHCGVRDYSICLARALWDTGIDIQIMAPLRLGMRDGITRMSTLRWIRPDVVHLQFVDRSPLLASAAYERSTPHRVQRMANQPRRLCWLGSSLYQLLSE